MLCLKKPIFTGLFTFPKVQGCLRLKDLPWVCRGAAGGGGEGSAGYGSWCTRVAPVWLLWLPARFPLTFRSANRTLGAHVFTFNLGFCFPCPPSGTSNTTSVIQDSQLRMFMGVSS